jgi:hypothetical protein
MQRLRGSWLALLTAAMLMLFSVSVAIGADPETDANRGQSIASFVHSLIFDEPATDDELVAEDETQAEDEETDEESAEDEDQAEDEEAALDETADEKLQGETASGAEHGACVSEVARSDAVGPPNDNHGGAVSEAARETCWEPEPVDEEVTTSEEVITQEFRNHGECVSETARSDEVGGRNDNHGGAVNEAARETCAETEEPTAEAEVTAEGAVLGNGNGGGAGNGNGHGQGHNKP